MVLANPNPNPLRNPNPNLHGRVAQPQPRAAGDTKLVYPVAVMRRAAPCAQPDPPAAQRREAGQLHPLE